MRRDDFFGRHRIERERCRAHHFFCEAMRLLAQAHLVGREVEVEIDGHG
jgi:hypothetical protein